MAWVCSNPLVLAGDYSIHALPAGGPPLITSLDENNDNHDPGRNDPSKRKEYICSDFVPLPNTESLTFPGKNTHLRRPWVGNVLEFPQQLLRESTISYN